MFDDKDILSCPACGKEMKKIYSKEAGVYVDVCLEGCGGIFFNNRELEKFDEQTENADEILNSIKDRHFINVDESLTRKCPSCGTNMVKNGVAGTDIQIDVCNVCGGKFLDNGELQKVREAVLNKDDEVTLQLVNQLYLENYNNILSQKNYAGINGYKERVKFFQNIAKIL